MFKTDYIIYSKTSLKENVKDNQFWLVISIYRKIYSFLSEFAGMFTAKYMYIHHYKYIQVSLTLFTLHVYTNYMNMYRHLMFLLIRDFSFIPSYTLYNKQYREWKERLIVHNINCLKFPKKVGSHNFNYCKVYNTNLSYNGINAWSCYIRTWTER